ncbi:MAG: isoaspartyl peptidase/L-asparaginase family protein [Steroidobacteraceae bacterium]
MAHRMTVAGWAVAIHGGAGARLVDLTAAELESVRDALRRALAAASEVLTAAGRSVDAVQSAVHVMESSGVLNAGRGAVLNQEGRVELDAALMDGRSGRAGAVAAVQRVANPIDLARAVLEDGRHVLLAGPGAVQFARDHGLALVAQSELITARRCAELESVRSAARDSGASATPPWHSRGTVGAVALDVHGDLAAATSTGGVTNKRPGRVGDSPIVGAGTFAENGVCAVSATGAGEHFIRCTAAGDVRARMKYQGASLEAATRAVIAVIETAGGYGGLIAVDSHGAIAMPYSTPAMLRGTARAGEPPEVIVEA